MAVERLVGVYSWAPRKDEVIFSFVCRITGGASATSEESDDVRFFAPDELPANTFPEHVHRLRDALWPNHRRCSRWRRVRPRARYPWPRRGWQRARVARA